MQTATNTKKPVTRPCLSMLYFGKLNLYFNLAFKTLISSTNEIKCMYSCTILQSGWVAGNFFLGFSAKLPRWLSAFIAVKNFYPLCDKLFKKIGPTQSFSIFTFSVSFFSPNCSRFKGLKETNFLSETCVFLTVNSFWCPRYVVSVKLHVKPAFTVRGGR